jgi:site-specific recombinase XerD
VNALRQSAAEYLAVRRALGYRLEGTERFLGQFIDYLEAQGAERITVEHALAWATLPQRGEHWHAMRLGAVRGFARYLHEVDRSVEVPPADVVPDRTRRAVPYLYSDEEILALMAATDSVLRAPHKQATFRTLIGLLVATGMRVGEAIALGRTDFDADTGALVVAPREVRQVARAAAAPNHDHRAERLPGSPRPPPSRRRDRAAPGHHRRHPDVDARRPERVARASSARGPRATVGDVPAAAA